MFNQYSEPIDREVLALDKAKSRKFIKHRRKIRRSARARGQRTQAIGPSRLLGPRCERPRHRRTTDKPDEVAPPLGFPSMSQSTP